MTRNLRRLNELERQAEVAGLLSRIPVRKCPTCGRPLGQKPDVVVYLASNGRDPDIDPPCATCSSVQIYSPDDRP